MNHVGRLVRRSMLGLRTSLQPSAKARVVTQLPLRSFSQDNKPNENLQDMEGYSSDEEGKKVFESDRRFSNYMMFIGSFSMILIFMMANAMQLKKKED